MQACYQLMSWCGRMDHGEGLLLAMGNPLLDIIAVTDKAFLEKYGMKPNDAILATNKHKPMYDEMVEKFKVEYVAGGAAQNTVRGVQWILGKPGVSVYMGCIGNDKFGKILKEKAKEAGVNARYMEQDKEPTGTCAVIITGHERSLCANLAAANCFHISHLQKRENWAFVENALYYYLTSFFLTVSPDSMLEVVCHANTHNKLVCLNLSASFLVEQFEKPMMQIFPYVDIVFGNETEAAAFGKKLNFGTDDVEKIALKITTLNKVNTANSRMAVITQGQDPVIVAYEGKITSYPVTQLGPNEIVDTNGAGDAFVGGFLAMYIQKKPIAVCVKCGIYAATEVIKQSGCTFPPKPNFKENV